MNITQEQRASLDELSSSIEIWAEKKGLHLSDPSKQFLKVVEEVGEVASAIAKGKKDELQDGIGDVFVTIVILAMQNNLSIRDCVATAYAEIADRKGRMVDGVFVKESDL